MRKLIAFASRFSSHIILFHHFNFLQNDVDDTRGMVHVAKYVEAIDDACDSDELIDFFECKKLVWRPQTLPYPACRGSRVLRTMQDL